MVVSDNTNAALSNENGSYMPPSERNWIQIQTNGYKMVIDKLNAHREIYLSTGNHSPLTHRHNNITRNFPRPFKIFRNKTVV
jgi:hypothetical protein